MIKCPVTRKLIAKKLGDLENSMSTATSRYTSYSLRVNILTDKKGKSDVEKEHLIFLTDIKGKYLKEINRIELALMSAKSGDIWS